MKREEMLARAEAREEVWDVVIVGGGATGIGAAVDAAARGYSVLLLEQCDFGKGTSSRSTKLVHGGVRYLQQGNVSLVMEALKERGILRNNAPHLVHELRFIVPNYDWWETPFYGIGMKVYDMLAGKYGFGPSRILSDRETLEAIPTLETAGLRGGVQYYDGQFDDSRLLVNLAQTAAEHGAVLLNYARVTQLIKGAGGFLQGLVFVDEECGAEHRVKARSVVNATGAFSDGLRLIDDPEADPIIAPSQGVHLVLDRSFLPTDSAIMVPHTRDGRVMFAIPWHDRALIGTTDTAIETPSLEPLAREDEIDMILDTAGGYLHRRPTRDDIMSVFCGIRPLVKESSSKSTAALSREHAIHVSGSGLLTIAGGKWTTYRKMAEDCIDHAATLGQLDERECPTKTLRIHGHVDDPGEFGELTLYGSDAGTVSELIDSSAEFSAAIHPRLPIRAGQIAWAVRIEMARTLDDVLARRTRSLLLDAAATREAAPAVAALLAAELGRDQAWQQTQVEAFDAIAAVHSPS